MLRRFLGSAVLGMALLSAAPATAVQAVRFTIGEPDNVFATWRLPKNLVPTFGSGLEGDFYKSFNVQVNAIVDGHWSRVTINSAIFDEELATLSIWQNGVRISIAYIFRYDDNVSTDLPPTFWVGPGASPKFITGKYVPGQNSGGDWLGGLLYITDTSIPEPATWAMLISGFGLIGMAARRRRTART